MALEITVGPPQLAINEGHMVLVTDPDGQIVDPVLKIRTSNEEVYRLFTQAVEDMAALRLPIKRTDHLSYVPAGGVPWRCSASTA
jgi:hypothetical protein